MHPRVAELVELLTRERAALLGAVAAVPADQLDRRPAPDVWSVGELLDHLAQVEAGSAQLLARRLARAKEGGLPAESESSTTLPRLDRETFRTMAPREAPEFVRPTPGARTEEALDRLHRSREALLQVLHDGDGLALGQVKAMHATLGELDLYEWAAFIAHHEARHVDQLHRIGATLGATPT
jgi:hypothetical protein